MDISNKYNTLQPPKKNSSENVTVCISAAVVRDITVSCKYIGVPSRKLV